MNVREKEIDVRSRFQNGDCLVGILCDYRAETSVFDQIGCENPEHGLVLDHQNDEFWSFTHHRGYGPFEDCHM